ncbi:MAG: Gfo/Idh/MocA family oxidoreductase [Spirosomataceae bacterium]
MKTKENRRSFLQKISIGASAIGLTPLIASSHSHLSPYNGPKLRVALCGLGRYAGYLAEGIAISEYCTVAGIVTGTPSKAVTWKAKYNIPEKNIYNYQNFDQIAANKDIDLVYVVLPNGMHKEYVIRAAKAGKHVIVEKPMALNARECEEMIKACKEAGVQLAMGYRLHFEPHHLEIKRLGQEKVFGQVRLIEVSLGYGINKDPNDWHFQKALSGGGPLMNLGVYCVQAARYVLGEEPISVTAQIAPEIDKTIKLEVETAITWQLEFPSGAVGTSTATYDCGIDRFYAGADNGFFELSPAVSYGPFRGRSPKGEIRFEDINQQMQQMDEIAKVILAKQPLPAHITGEEGHKDMKVIDAIYQAAKTGKKVQI